MMVSAAQFGQELKARRRQRRWSQERLAERAAIEQTQVSAYERGRSRPSLDTITKIARAFGERPDELARAAGYEVAPLAAGAETDLDAAAVRQLLAIPDVRRMLQAARESEGEAGVRELMALTARILGIIGDRRAE